VKHFVGCRGQRSASSARLSFSQHCCVTDGHALVVNPETGELWQTEQGPNGGDEIDIIKAGKNYGWPKVIHGRQYFGPYIFAAAIATEHLSSRRSSGCRQSV
jgi:hypothetical protein